MEITVWLWSSVTSAEGIFMNSWFQVHVKSTKKKVSLHVKILHEQNIKSFSLNNKTTQFKKTTWNHVHDK